MNPLLRLAAVITIPFALAHCGNSAAPLAATSTAADAVGSKVKYDVDVTRTELGIPHIKANDLGSMGYGLGYAFAEDNLCVMLEDFITIRGERSKYFGGDGSYTIFSNGNTTNNIDSDFFWKLTSTQSALAKLKNGLAPEAQNATVGFKDGYNRYLREVKAGAHPGRHAACAAMPWLVEATEDDMYRRYLRLGLLASSSVFVGEIGTAQPPVAGTAPAVAPTTATMADALKRDPGPLAFFNHDRPLGSNMYALGSDATENAVPILFGNPHFPWEGTERLYISHLTVPGKMDIMGSSLYGVPAILIGFTPQFAWSHTVSSAYRFTFYELTLDPSDPTKYLYNGASMAMEKVPLAIEVKGADGKLTALTRTLYKSKFGPMLTLSASGVKILPWTNGKAYTLRDANYENDRFINHFFRWNLATSFEEFKKIQAETVAVPWVNTIATGPGDKAYYADITAVPNVNAAKVQNCSTSAQAQVLAQLVPGLPLLDGSMPSCEWDTDADAPAPGIFGPSHLPKIERSDWVGNNNDSYWLTNPAQPLTGFARIIGDENTARTLRTRHSILKMQHRFAGTDGRPGKKWNMQSLEESVLDSHIYSGDLARNDVVSKLCVAGNVMTTSGPVDVSKACAVLSKWDLSNNLDSVGGHVWREFWLNARGANGFYTTPYSGSDPVNTPNTINVASPEVQAALGDAVTKIQGFKIPLDAKLGAIQHSGVNGKDIPIFGGLGDPEGAFTIGIGDLAADGYNVTFGNSYIQVVSWDASGPIADGFITYSQSTDPANPHFNDFTKDYSQKKWQHFPFKDADVQARKQSQIHLSQ